MTRKIFNFDDLNQSKIVNNFNNKNNIYYNTISAAGCLIYKIINDQLYLLLIKYYNQAWVELDDFGGKIDIDDENIFDTISRELLEETNNIIDYNTIAHYKNIHFYNRNSKYYNILIQVNQDFHNDTTVFGNLEIHDNLYRFVKWYNYKDVKNNIATRIYTNTQLIDYLDNLI